MALPKKRFAAVLDNVKTALAGLTVFQTLTGADDADEAKASIYQFGVDDDDERNIPPRIILDLDGHDGRKDGGGFRGPTFVLMLHEYAIPQASSASYQSAAEWFWGQIDDWYDAFEDAVNGSGQLSVDNIEMSLPPGPIDSEDLPEVFPNRNVWMTQFRVEVQT